jgi:hypothetical protein
MPTPLNRLRLGPHLRQLSDGRSSVAGTRYNAYRLPRTSGLRLLLGPARAVLSNSKFHAAHKLHFCDPERAPGTYVLIDYMPSTTIIITSTMTPDIAYYSAAKIVKAKNDVSAVNEWGTPEVRNARWMHDAREDETLPRSR